MSKLLGDSRITIRRDAGGDWVQGQWVSSMRSFEIVGVLRQATAKEMERLPEGRRESNDGMILLSQFDLLVGNSGEGRNGDRFYLPFQEPTDESAGLEYEVVSKQPYGKAWSPLEGTKYICVRRKAEGEP